MANCSLYLNPWCDKLNVSETEREDHEHELEVALPAAILSLVLGLLAISSNGLLLLTLYKDPLKCFKGRCTTVFVCFLALSDFLGALIVQLLHSLCMFCRLAEIELTTVYNFAIIGSHLGTKISVFTVVGMSFDRYLAVKLVWRYRTLVKVERVAFFNVCVWVLMSCFEASHSADQELMHKLDMHIQTTVPLTLLTVINLATYFEFRRYSRNTVFAQRTLNATSGPSRRNIEIEKNIVKVVAAIMVVLFVSLVPYLVTKHYEDRCHEEHDAQEEHAAQKCHEETRFAAVKNIATSLLCVSSVFNPFLYAFRISNYRRAFRIILKRICGGTETQEMHEEAS